MESFGLKWRYRESRAEGQKTTATSPRLPGDVEKEVEYTQLGTTER
ncbi:hypothetical protein PF006_g14656 [Phytophthora fragariae]|uniref:Uncharacterized protein n=1 Tax=Phytophthora fragariae TaxID=53985 RepID=A0A6A3TJD4_9STRA|nr:hypothetical protein PF003_g28527 [Phytophthora fragariae]KAE8908058.1 hypothetical protein PF003_g8122 [Phytophthora fragariae]KAE9135244.1 hypothetical protein PF006_g14656 [Phytophthora fragariae]